MFSSKVSSSSPYAAKCLREDAQGCLLMGAAATEGGEDGGDQKPACESGAILWTERALVDPSWYADFEFTDLVLEKPVPAGVALKNLRAVHTDTMLEILCRVVFDVSDGPRDDAEVSTTDGAENNSAPPMLLDVPRRPGADERIAKVLEKLRFFAKQLQRNQAFREFSKTTEQPAFGASSPAPKSRLSPVKSTAASIKYAIADGGSEEEVDAGTTSKHQVVFDASDKASLAVLERNKLKNASSPSSSSTTGGSTAGFSSASSTSRIAPEADAAGSVGVGEMIEISRLADEVNRTGPDGTTITTQLAVATMTTPRSNNPANGVGVGDQHGMQQLALPPLDPASSDAECAAYKEMTTAELANQLFTEHLKPEFASKISANDLDVLLQIFLNCFVLDDCGVHWVNIADDWDADSSGSEAIAAYSLPAVIRHSSKPNCFIGELAYRFGDDASSSAGVESTGFISSNKIDNGGFFMTTRVAVRSLRALKENEPLTVDYGGWPDCYAPVRSQEKAHLDWDKENNPRWAAEVEIVRCFVCEHCGSGEVCAQNVEADMVWEVPLKCRDCGREASSAHQQACRAAEQKFMAASAGEDDGAPLCNACEPIHPMTRHHYMVFASCWFYFHEFLLAQPEVSKKGATSTIETILECVSRLNNGLPHPVMIRFVSFLQALYRPGGGIGLNSAGNGSRSERAADRLALADADGEVEGEGGEATGTTDSNKKSSPRTGGEANAMDLELQAQKAFLEEEDKLVSMFFPDEREKLKAEVQNLLERNRAAAAAPPFNKNMPVGDAEAAAPATGMDEGLGPLPPRAGQVEEAEADVERESPKN
mmetsp:Transcript_18765/g.46927  ORF Transcript_18765/g.46927 Transcript_18765/m.46927 type:complete len:823 (+) Transcript_18765:148-2616(+)|eukprot:CAMPEP_0178992262 /NCGR_PEP_ID=MMETSP0795-20121207/6009_1 /TAXON_ID=88552 /ORGANISM="Amoebophrya sp., Strain Ameob2" /LENGTH=822 /DNA_ID=CAMNT_0020684109 /DNA_START=176 /DNA_END=2644 /DNA_ORIENTATION=-